MRTLLLPALVLLLALPPPAHAAAGAGFDASAAGTASFVLTDPSTGAVLCAASAAFALWATDAGGAIAWDAPACGATGAAPFAFWCTDACFQDCDVTSAQVRCERGVSLDGAWTEFTLARNGAFSFLRLGDEGNVEAHGTLLVTTWPDA